jgi:NAD(P)-dependent dehydrogenase (short-subunit alcohol dehydrogenase family)
MSTATRQPLQGHTALVTGATGGIGHHTARALARCGARVIITGRNGDTGQQAAEAIARESGSDSVTCMSADHSTVGGNQDLAERVRTEVPRLDLLVNNVGGLYPTITAELRPLLRASSLSHCVNVVSAGFTMHKGDPFTDIQSIDRFFSGDAYAQTKLLNVLASLAWAHRLAADEVTLNVVHPGLAWTQMTRSMTARTSPSLRLAWPLLRLLQRRGSAAKAGQRVAFVASSPQIGGYTGRYFEGRRTPSRLSARELDPHHQDRAWHLGAALMAGAPTHRRRPPGETDGDAAGSTVSEDYGA